jgi:hypothetical protein
LIEGRSHESAHEVFCRSAFFGPVFAQGCHCHARERQFVANPIGLSIHVVEPALVFQIVAGSVGQNEHVLLRRIAAQRLGSIEQHLAHLRRCIESFRAEGER